SIGIAVNKHSRNKAAVLKLVDFLSSSYAQRLIRTHTLSIPASRQAAEERTEPNDLLNRPFRFHLYRDLVPGYRRHRDLQLQASEFYKLRELLKQYWSDLVDEDALCEQLGS